MLPTQYKKEILNRKVLDKKIQKIHNNFIENQIIDYNKQSLRIVFYLSTILENMDFNKSIFENIEIDGDDLLLSIKETFENLKKQLKSIQKTSITFQNADDEDEWYESISLLPRFKITKSKNKGHTVTFDMYSKVAKLIIDVPKKYGGTVLNINDLLKIENKHAFRMLPLLHLIMGYTEPFKKQKKYELDDINVFFGTNYKTFYEIERKILQPAKNELDQNAKLSFYYDFEVDLDCKKVGRKPYSHVTIFPIIKTRFQASLV